MNSATIEFSAERWALVERLFDEAMELQAHSRHEFLRNACEDDTELLSYLQGLVADNSSVEADIEQTIVDTLTRAFGEPDGDGDSIRGEMIGPYRVERLIGAGGMGMVYLAERADQQFEQQVAIKLGRHRLVDPQTELRFRNERQILADLDHPNIGRLLDGGTTRDGTPYLVMEFIDGVRIDTYCDTNALGIVERLRLFQTICAAVHHAHQNLIVHRDIKAPNILVTDDGTPKLLDFGIAKLTDTAGTMTDGITREGAVILTPENAAPEQVMGQTATTATDTYALGLLLHVLLTGLRAHPIDETMTPREFAELICSRSVPRPSQRLVAEYDEARNSGDDAALHALERMAADRRSRPDKLARRLRGDLDTIILNALRKDPLRRYRSVSALSDDIELHLKSMPIVARADSWGYRTSRFLKRHYAAVSAAAAVGIMLLSFSVVVFLQNQRIAEERDTAREVSQFLEDIFMSQDPARARGADVTADEILAAGAERIQQDLGGRPEIQSTLMGTIGRVYYSLGAYEPSIEMLEEALRLREQTYGRTHPSVAVARNDLAETLIRLAQYDRAQALLLAALDANRTHPETSPAIARNLFNLAETYLATGDLDAAETVAEESIGLLTRLGPDFKLELAEAKSLLARTLQVSGDLDRAERLLADAIELVEDSGGQDHPLMAYYLQNLGVLQRSRGELAAAEKTLERAIEATRRILGDKHDLLASTLLDQGRLLHDRGKLQDAEFSIREALALDTELLGADHPSVAYDLTILGMLLHDKTDFASAEAELTRALAIYEQNLGMQSQYTASVLTELGAVMNSTGRAEDALPVLERALEIREKDYPPEHRLVAGTRAELGDAMARLGRFAEAEPLLLDSVAALQETTGRRKDRAKAALERYYVLADQGF